MSISESELDTAAPMTAAEERAARWASRADTWRAAKEMERRRAAEMARAGAPPGTRIRHFSGAGKRRKTRRKSKTHKRKSNKKMRRSRKSRRRR